MLEWRTLALGFAVFTATFMVGWWFGLGNLASRLRPSPARAVAIAAAPAQAPAAEAPPAAPVPAVATPPERPGLTDDDGLRRQVILRARAYQEPACNQDAKALYVRAATSYAEVLMRAAGCQAFPKCGLGMHALDRVWQSSRSAADLAVAEAMAAVHKAGGLSERSFRGDVGRAVQVIAAVEFEPGPVPSCAVASASPRPAVRDRVRR
jgi:hypothetical protein